MNHHPLGPSSLYRRQQCPGSLRMEDGLPDCSDTDGIREMGITLHAAVQNHEMRRDLEIGPLRLLETCDAALAPYEDWSAWHWEQRVEVYEPFTSRMVLFGTTDWYAVHPDGDKAALIDFKFGYNPVNAPHENLQLAAYSLGIMQRHPEVAAVEAMIVQPTVTTDNHPSWTFTDPDGLFATIAKIEAACNHAAWVLCAGDWCRYCNAKAICPAFRAYTSVALREHATLPAITADNVADLLAKSKMAARLLDELDDRIRKAVEANGGKLGGVYLHSQGGNRYIPSVMEAYQSLKECLTADEFMALCDLSPTTLENALVPKLIANGKAKSAAEAKRLIAAMVRMERGKGKQVLKIEKED